jgi:hypothetical protein
MNAARALDARLARNRTSSEFDGGGRLTRQLSMPAFMTAMKHVGSDAPPDVQEAYFQDNERLYLDHNSQKSPRGLVNRHGRVRERTIYGKDKDGQTTRVIVRR